MCVLMLRSLHRRAAAASACAHCFSSDQQFSFDRRHAPAALIILALLLLLLLFLMFMPSAFLVCSTSSSSSQTPQPDIIAASPPEIMQSSILQAPSPSITQENHEIMSQSQAPHSHQGEAVMRLHRRFGFNLEKAYEMFKRSCQASNCRRRPAFRILHAVPSGPNPISNYLPSSFYDRFSSWAPAPPPF